MLETVSRQASRTRPTPITFLLALLVGGVGVLALHTTFGLGGYRPEGLFNHGVYNVLMGGAALAVLARGLLVRAQRAAWLTMGAGALCWSLGDLYYTLFLEGPGTAGGGGLSPADVLYLSFYPCCYVALVLLLAAHLHETRIAIWLDGLIGGLAAATVGAALVLPPILHSAHGDAASLGVALAYPIGDLLLLAFALSALAMTGWRPGRVWLLIAAALVVTAVADSAYLYQTATDTYSVENWTQSLWPLSAVLLALAAWTPWPRPARRRVEGWRLVSVPSLSLLAALGVLAYGNLPTVQLTPTALVLAAATVLAVCVHLVATVRENVAMLAGSRRLALTDPLTGLGNRRLLMEDLQVACRRAGAGETWDLVLYDLNGFKRYNDTFGHPAGDALLARLSDKLRTVVAPHGTAYRMGGDEFCALLRDSSEHLDVLVPDLRGGALRAGAGLLDRRGPRGGEHPARARRPRRGDAARRPASVPAQGPDPRGERRAPAPRRAAAGLPGAPPRPARTPARGGRARARGRAAAGRWPARSSTCSPAPRSCTTSARSRSPTRSSTSPARWTTRSGYSCAATRSSASASSKPPPPCARWRSSCAPATSATTVAATPTACTARRSRWARGSSSCATRSTR